MHFVRFSGLASRANYTYKVKSGADGGVWSREYTFRSLYDTGVSTVAIYGDMGAHRHNNMGNLRDDCSAGRIDALVHMGDHAYNLDTSADRHGDAYMNAFEPTLATCPWLPVIGNHESYLGPTGDVVGHDVTERYLNQTWGVAYGQQDTSTSALGSLLTKGTYYGMGSHGASPSGTSRYNSIDIGLFHIVGLDLDPGPNGGGSGWALWNSSAEDGTGGSAQGVWFEADLAAAAANRERVPWIIVTSHFPLVHTMLRENAATSAKHYVGDEGEDSVDGSDTEHHFAKCKPADPGCYTVGELVQAQQALIPMMEKYGVDVYDAGHVHSYEVTWPQKGGATTAQSYDKPDGIVYITEGHNTNLSSSPSPNPNPNPNHLDASQGNGGVPPVPATNTITKCTAPCRMKGTGGAYGRFTATDGHTLKYEHVENPTGKVTDTWAITK